MSYLYLNKKCGRGLQRINVLVMVSNRFDSIKNITICITANSPLNMNAINLPFSINHTCWPLTTSVIRPPIDNNFVNPL